MLEFDVPVGRVEELPPRTITSIRKLYLQAGIVVWLLGYFDEAHIRLFRRSASLFDVAFKTTADQIIPGRPTTLRARNNVI